MKTYTLFILLLLTAPLRADSFADAVTAFEHGDTTSAETTLRALLDQQPSNAAAWGLLGAVLDAEKKLPDATLAFQHALRLTPNSPSLLNNYANHQMALGDRNGAAATYRKSIALDPHRANANLQLASLDVQNKNGAEALHCLDRLSPADAAAPPVQILRMQALFLAQRPAEAEAILNQYSTPTNDPRLNFSLALALASVEKYAEAETFFSRALETVPTNFDVLYNLGLAAYHAHHLDRARSALESALSQRPQDVDVLYNLAGVNIDLREREKALRLLAEAARLDPTRPNVQLALAQTASALGLYGDAMLAYEKYLKLVPNDTAAQREHLFMIAVTGDPRPGLAELQTFARLHPKDATSRYELGLLQAKTEPAEAARQFAAALALDSAFAPARLGRGVMNFLQANYPKALPDLEFAAARYPDNPNVLDRLGEEYLALGRLPDSLRVLQKASTLAPKDGRILMHLSRAFARSGQTAEAHEALARFRAVGSESGNVIPQAGLLDFLTLSPQQLQAKYAAEVQRRLTAAPDDPDLNARYLQVLLDQGNTAEVAHVAANLLALKPPFPIAADAGHALLEAGRPEQARPLLAYAAAASSSPAVVLDLAVATFHTTGPGPGLTELDKIPASQHSGNYYLARAAMLDSAGQFDDALAAITQALQAAPTDFNLYSAAVALLLRRHLPDKALALLNRAPKPVNSTPKFLVLQAETLAAAHRPNDAETLLKQVHVRWPEWASAYVVYGILLERQGDRSQAKTELDAAHDLGISEAQIQAERSRLGA